MVWFSKQQFQGILAELLFLFYFSYTFAVVVVLFHCFSVETQISLTWAPRKPERFMAGQDNPK